MQKQLQALRQQLHGELYFDELLRRLYATDGSIYRELPLAVAYPKDAGDIKKLLAFAREHGSSLIPRTAGTSLGGQCVGSGIVVDVSKHMNRILEVNAEEGWVRLQPGVIRDELNAHLKGYGLFFGPNTSTASRAMIGGMLGNNSCGTTSIRYGATRDHVLEVKAVLSDGSEAVFGPLSTDAFRDKCAENGLEGALYRQINEALSRPERQAAIREHFPKPEIHRRNTGYAVDVLLGASPFTASGPDFNFSKMLAGSEGTLAISTEIRIHVSPLPPAEEALVCAHFTSLQESLEATLVAMRHQPYACELMDKFIMDCTRENRQQQRNRFFLQGDPAAILIIELRDDTREGVTGRAEALIASLQDAGFGYAFPIIYPPDTRRVMALRAAGFGVLSNVKGDRKPLEFVEDTAVALADLPAYIGEFQDMMAQYGQQAVYYAHAGAGELHTRPSVNLKSPEGVRELRAIAEASARLVKKYRGSLSGEHGDGRVRGEFIPLVLGEDNYQLFREIKQSWDPHGLFNPGKITDTPPMDTSLRYLIGPQGPAADTVFDFSHVGGILRAAEKCNGSGDCRKLAHVSGGVMCPSYMATRNEKDTTRGRANALRDFLTYGTKANRFDYTELYEVMDLCLSCKGCASECPSNVDMATLKAEFLHHYYQANGIPLRARVFGNIGRLNALGMRLPSVSNFFFTNPLLSGLAKRFLGVAPQRSLPLLSPTTLRGWYARNRATLLPGAPQGRQVWFFCDEFTNYNDTVAGIAAIRLLSGLGYEVLMADHGESGRAYLSKGLLPQAQRLARQNVACFEGRVGEEAPLVGVEPSAILSFRDEYPRLVAPEQREAAQRLAKNALMLEEFLAREAEAGRVSAERFTKTPRRILLHGHCHQKALASVDSSAFVLSLPENYQVEVIPSGCCGMAGSFGYEAEHYELSMQVGELVLFPAVRAAPADTAVAAPGTSCRHQIKDGTGRKALHPAEVLWEALAEAQG
ncbi:MAG: FAD-binding protein [Lewinellaceae bacterium]|nr:FAD-binding protein [Lewinellaceae bacterium]